jgi:hypothetical protein
MILGKKKRVDIRDFHVKIFNPFGSKFLIRKVGCVKVPVEVLLNFLSDFAIKLCKNSSISIAMSLCLSGLLSA